MLKKLTFVIGAWVGLVSIASAEMLIKQDLSVSVELEATKYVSLVNVRENESLRKLKTLSLEDKNTIIKTYNNINGFLSKDSICKGGSFSISPIYEYKNGKKTQNGFESLYTLNCEFSEAQKEDYNKIIQKIESEVRENPYLLFALPSIDKVLDEKSLLEIDEQLNVKMLELALQKAKEYSNLSRQKCSIKEIDLNTISHQKPTPILMKSTLNAAPRAEAAMLEDISLPTAKNTQKTAQGSVVFSCR